MNKADLIDAVAKEAELTKAGTQKVIESLFAQIKKSVAKGESVQLIGFGSFNQGKRAQRIGRNPRTGDKIKIPAAKTVQFSAGKAFKDAVNSKKK